MKAIITVGISASGKSTWARQWVENGVDVVDVNRDTQRWVIMKESGLEPCWQNWKWKWEDKVTARCDAIIAAAAEAGHDLIVSDTNLDKNRREQLIKKLSDLGYSVELKLFPIGYDEAVRRDNARENGVGASVIQKQHQQWLDSFGGRVVMDPSLPTAVIVDIDGTVALMDGIRGPFEWDKVDQDLPHQIVIEMVKGLAAAGHFIIFTSGRDGCCRDKTTNYLLKHFDGWQEYVDFALLMRKENDQRKDTIVKEEIFREYIYGKANIVAVVDDRPSVCRMWRDLGLNVVQVGNPYIEF